MTTAKRSRIRPSQPPAGDRTLVDAAYQRLRDHGVAVTEVIERGYGKTFYFHDPNGILPA